MTLQMQLRIYRAILFVRGSNPYNCGTLGLHEPLLTRAHNRLVVKIVQSEQLLEETRS